MRATCASIAIVRVFFGALLKWLATRFFSAPALPTYSTLSSAANMRYTPGAVLRPRTNCLPSKGGCGVLMQDRSEEHTSELQSLMRISYAVFCLKKKKNHDKLATTTRHRKHITSIKPHHTSQHH